MSKAKNVNFPSFFIIAMVVHFSHHYHKRRKRTLTGGGPRLMNLFFQNLKITILFQKNHHFIGFLFIPSLGNGGDL